MIPEIIKKAKAQALIYNIYINNSDGNFCLTHKELCNEFRNRLDVSMSGFNELVDYLIKNNFVYIRSDRNAVFIHLSEESLGQARHEYDQAHNSD